MGTRSLLTVNESDQWDPPKYLYLAYRQFDGYPTGRGQDVKRLLEGHQICNGFNGEKENEWHNGVQCMAAWLLMKEKEDHLLGGIYLYPPGETYDSLFYSEEFLKATGKETPRRKIQVFKHHEEYLYIVGLTGGQTPKIMLTVIDTAFDTADGGTIMYHGLLDDFDPEATEEAFSRWRYPEDYKDEKDQDATKEAVES